MELDDLKQQLKQKLSQPATEYSETDIALLLKGQAQSVLDKLKRSLWLEIILSVVFTIAFVAVALSKAGFVMRVYFGSFLIFTVGFGLVQYYLVKYIDKTATAPLPVKDNLSVINAILSRYVKRVYWLSMVLLPLCLFYSLWLNYIDYSRLHADAAERIFSPKTTTVWLKALAAVALLSIPQHFFTRWYLHKLYGVYLLKLRGYIQELQQPEEKVTV